MCHGLAPAFLLRAEIAEELLRDAAERADAAAAADGATDDAPSFAIERDPAGEAITGGATDRSDRPTGGPT